MKRKIEQETKDSSALSFDEALEAARGPAPAVVNGSRITADPSGGFKVYHNDRFAGWKPTLEEAEAFLTKVKARQAAKAAEKETPAADPQEVKKGKKQSQKTEKRSAGTSEKSPAAVEPEPEKPTEAPTVPEPTPNPEIPEKAETPASVPPAEPAPSPEQLAVLAAMPDALIRAEAERRGFLKPAPAPRGARRPSANREAHTALTKQAWVKARELAKAKGGKPQDHMKEAWAGLVRD